MKTRIRIFPFASTRNLFAFHRDGPARERGPNRIRRSITTTSPQYDDPYVDFRNARYSNAGLLNERDEIKLGTQLHREVTKKYPLTDTGLARVERLGQRCARAGLRSNLTYKFHVIQSREINGFSLPGGQIYITTALLKMANDDELGGVLCHEVGHVSSAPQSEDAEKIQRVRRHRDFSRRPHRSSPGSIARDLGVALGKWAGP
jgi:predicted Zn-dependent protease